LFVHEIFTAELTENPMSRPSIASVCLAALLLAAPAQAAMSPARGSMTADILRTGGSCSYGSHLDVSGYCVDSMDYSRRCAPGTFAIPAPNGNGHRCVPTEWLQSSGWFADWFGLRD
jgi:hypothetical protein